MAAREGRGGVASQAKLELCGLARSTEYREVGRGVELARRSRWEPLAEVKGTSRGIERRRRTRPRWREGARVRVEGCKYGGQGGREPGPGSGQASRFASEVCERRLSREEGGETSEEESRLGRGHQNEECSSLDRRVALSREEGK